MSASDIEAGSALSKLPDISRLALLTTATLYLLGFISVTAYLSRFGFVDFDIFNARYLIGGVFPLIGILMSFSVGWRFYQRYFSSPSNSSAGSLMRVKAILLFLGAIALTSVVFEVALEAARYQPREELKYITFSALFYDPAAELASLLGIDKSTDLAVIFHYAFYYSPFILLLMLKDNWSGIRALLLRRSVDNATPTTAQREVTDGVKTDTSRKMLARFGGSIIWAIEYVLWTLITGLGFYTFYKLKAQLIDFDIIFQRSDFSFGVTFAWFYFSAVVLFSFACFTQFAPAHLASARVLASPHVRNFIFFGIYFLLPLLNSVYFFGGAIFPHVPSSIGGGEPREAVLRLSGSESKSLIVFILAESAGYLYVVERDGNRPRAIQISKASIEIIETKSQSNFAAANHR